MRLRWRQVVMAVTACLVLVPRAAAINIVPVFNSTDNQTPVFDLFNQGIQDLFTYAEGYYQDIIEDPGYTLTLNFWYEDLQDNYLGLYNTVTTSGGRVTEGNIRIDTRVGNGGDLRDWYIDTTPATDGEFDMQKDPWGTLPGIDQLDWITAGDIPDALEVGYSGLAPSDGQAFGKFDMLSTILHEVGHALGVRTGASENDDDDYDLNPSFVFGATIAAEIDTDEGAPDPGHMKPGTLLMCGGCAAANLRRRPSHADIFAMATSLGMTQIDVPRREFLGGGVFNFAPNWSGNRTPDNNDEAYIRSAGLVTMNAGDVVAGLTLIDSTTLVTGANTLNVNGTLTLDSRFFNSSAGLVVGAGGGLIANDVQINRNGVLDLAGGVVSVLGDLHLNERELAGDDEGAISGNGTVTVIGKLTSVGIFRPQGGVLTINAGSFDLDGNPADFGLATIDATLGNIIFNGTHDDSFDGDVTVGFGRLVTFNDAWTLEENGDVAITDGGLINNAAWHTDGNVEITHTVPFGVVGVGGTGAMVQGPTGAITTSGVVDFLGQATIGGAVHVTTEAARFSAGGTFTDTAAVTLDASTEMHLILANTYTVEPGATFTGPGALIVGELATLRLLDDAAVGTSLQNKGRMEIGNSPGAAAASAGFTQTSTGVAEFEIGGLLAGQQFDVLDVTGNIAIDGTLELSLINGFVPGPGDAFRIITADSVVGTFSSVLGANIGGGLLFQVVYNPTHVTLHVVGQPIPGDLDGDGFVGITDLNIVLSNWNQTVPPGDPLADPSGDDFVGIEDLNTVLGNWNKGIPPGVAANIPEPTGIGLVVSGFFLLRRTPRFSQGNSLA